MMVIFDSGIQAEWTELDLRQIRADPKQPRRRQRRSISEIAKSIRAFGFLQPIVVDEHFVVIIGHGRLEAAKHLEYKTVPVVVLCGLTDTQRRRLQIADNRLSELSAWDESLLIEQIEQLYDDSCSEIPGFSAAEIDDILGVPDIGKANCELPPQRETTLEQSELHLLVSCRASDFERMARLVAGLKGESWCTLEQGAR
jgi:ParB/RepB/Spo0J family partition protein